MEALVIVAIIVVAVIIIKIWVNANRKSEERDMRADLNRRIDQCRRDLIRDNNTASMKPLDPLGYNYRVVGKESLLAVEDSVDKLEWKSTGKRSASGMSFSVPIAKGIRYRVSTRSTRSEKDLVPTDSGRLVLTDKAASFEGRSKNERITWSQISDAQVLLDGYEIRKRNGPSRLFRSKSVNPQFAAILELLLVRVD